MVYTNYQNLMKSKKKVKYKVVDTSQKYFNEYYKYLEHLFLRAKQENGLQYIFTLLRVSGIEDGGWDPFVEAEEALIDFSKLLQKISKRGVNKQSFRLGLLIYCHAIEMSAPYHILFNLLRCIQGKTYIPFPFPGRPKSKKKPFEIIPASPNQKIKSLKKEAELAGEMKLINHIESFFDDDIRNAFYHSDYTLTDTEFRICEAGIPLHLSLEKLSEKLAKCFAFYNAFFHIYRQARLSFKKAKKFHRMPNFEVFELLTDAKEGLVGFKIHFSNNTTAFFERRKERVGGINIILEKDHINFFVGDLSKMQRRWIVNGRVFREKNTRYNNDCIWKPILFHGKIDEVIKEIESETKDEEVQGCLFYIKCTGHEATEFAIKSNKKIFEGDKKQEGKFTIVACGRTKNNKYIYDGTYFVNSPKVREIKKGLNRIKKFINQLRSKNIEVAYTLKYSLKRKIEPSKRKDGKSFTITLSMDDPRNTLCLSDLRILPKTDWKIKENWIE